MGGETDIFIQTSQPNVDSQNIYKTINSKKEFSIYYLKRLKINHENDESLVNLEYFRGRNACNSIYFHFYKTKQPSINRNKLTKTDITDFFTKENS